MLFVRRMRVGCYPVFLFQLLFVQKIHQQVKARSDIKKIWIYSYENFSAKQPDKYFNELESGMETIRDNPLTLECVSQPIFPIYLLEISAIRES